MSGFPPSVLSRRLLILGRLYYTATSRQTEDVKVQKYNPYPDRDSPSYQEKYRGDFVPCKAARGKRLNDSDEDSVHALKGPLPTYNKGALGSNRVLGIDQDACFDRYGRYGAYGMPPKPGSELDASRIDWHKVDWAELQRDCVADNRNRFDMTARKRPDHPDYIKTEESVGSGPQARKRSAILLRGYMEMRFTEELMQNMRAVITELALGSGGEYQVFLLYNVKGLGRSLDNLTASEYRHVVNEQVPPEFRAMTVLWNEMMWPGRYPLIPEEETVVHTSQWLPLQWFAQKHPQFDFYFNWEIDVRFTGHAYDFANKVHEWTTKQPRKLLWERNNRFFIPEYHDNNWTWFSEIVASRYSDIKVIPESDEGTVWGPWPPVGQPVKYWDPVPPSSAPNDEWGVGEDADLVTFMPMFDPQPTHYANLGAWFNYDQSLSDNGGPNRRGSVVTFYRLSNRLLGMMDLENTQEPGHHMGSEQWPHSVCLHHGLKAVYAPVSIFMDRKWPARALDWIFNNGDQDSVLEHFQYLPRTGAGSGGTDSVFGLGREHNFWNTATFYYRVKFGLDLYKRFLGYEVDGVGGPEV